MGRNITLRYGFTQFSYWAASTGATSFATACLLGYGLSSGTVGTLLAVAGVLSCVTQPLLAAVADRAERFLLVKMLVGMSLLCVACFGAQWIGGMPALAAGVLYVAGVWCSDAMVALLNALCVACGQNGWPVNYGVGRSMGSVASALSALVLGHVLERLGSAWMFALLVAFRLVCVFLLLGYPKLEKKQPSAGGPNPGCSVWMFFRRYRWYCAALAGFLFLGMYHAMTENYMIAIVGRLGGGSSHVGTALFISSLVGAPVIFCFQKIRQRFSDTLLLKISALSFLVKAVLFYFASAIHTIYLLQLLQVTSYAFLAPLQVYFAQSRVDAADMVKGQAFSTAAYALGCSAGNFAGGQLLTFGVQTLLLAGIVMALAGTVILFVSVNRTDLAQNI